KNLQGSGIPSSTNIWHINSPSIQEMGKTDTSNLTITYNNSNLQQCIEIFPNTLAYTVAASTTNNNSQNFVYDTSRFSVDVRVELPLWGYVKNFILKADTQSCEFPNSTQGNIKSMQMNIYSINSFPVDCDVQIYLCDANYNKLDSLLPVTSNVQHTFKAAPTYQSGDNEGKIMYPVKNLIQVSLDQDRIDKRKLRTMKHIITNATLSTQDANGSGSIPSVKFYSYYYLDVKIGVQADCVVSK
ncbi:MAG: hypothetical protein Q8880_03020, partial [Bacteroidota bacterium]|nr:hypothetical protein [Bacteroidota bacterium]